MNPDALRNNEGEDSGPQEIAPESQGVPSDKNKNHKKDGRTLDWLRSLALAGSLAVGAAEVAGPAAAQEISATKKEDAKEAYEKNRDYLKEVFGAISGGGMVASKKDALIIHVGGGKYYELARPLLGDLVAIAGDYRAKVERTKNKEAALAFKKALQMKVRQEIMMNGLSLQISELPQLLKDFEKGRKDTKEEMK